MEPALQERFYDVLKTQLKDKPLPLTQLCEEIAQGDLKALEPCLIGIITLINMHKINRFEHIPQYNNEYKLSAINQSILDFAIENYQHRALILPHLGQGYMMNLLDLFVLKVWVEGERQLQVIAQKLLSYTKESPEIIPTQIHINQLSENQQNMMMLDWVNRFVYEFLPKFKYLGLFSH